MVIPLGLRDHLLGRRTQAQSLLSLRPKGHGGGLDTNRVTEGLVQSPVPIQVAQAALHAEVGQLDTELLLEGQRVGVLLVVVEEAGGVAVWAGVPEGRNKARGVPARIGSGQHLVVESLVGQRRNEILPATPRA